MAQWNFPPRESPEESLRRLRELEVESDCNVPEQHLVSRVVLKRFTSLVDGKARKVGRYDVARRAYLDPKGIRGCAKATNFVKYASESIEKLWQTVENNLSGPLGLVCDREAELSSDAINVIKDCIALHYVRSYRYAQVHSNSVRQAEDYARRRMLTEHRGRVVREFVRVHGLWPAGDEALGQLVDENFKPWREREDSGALFRQSIEGMYSRVRKTLAPLSVEILHPPVGVEFVIGDSPAFAFSVNSQQSAIELNMALGDSQGVGMPLSPECIVCIGPMSRRMVVDVDVVRKMNEIQSTLANRQVYFRPDGNAGPEIHSYLEDVPATASQETRS